MIIGSKIFHKDQIYNSIQWAKKNRYNAPDGSIFIADIHEYTKGRRNKIWIFDKDQVILTILLKPKFTNQTNIEENLNLLNMAITSGILKPILKFNIGLKWPNDFYYKNKKVGGILSEAIWEKKQIKGIIFGIAINVNNSSPKLNDNYQAISISEIINRKINKKELFNNFLNSMNEFYQIWLRQDYDTIFNFWLKNQLYKNKNVIIHKHNGEKIKGKILNFLKNGTIELKKGPEIIQIPFYNIENLY